MKEIRRMIENGFAARRIAKILNLQYKDIQKIIKDNNLSIKKEPFCENLIDHIVQLYKDGVSAKSLGIKYSIDKRRVQKWAKKRNCLRSRNESHRFTFFDEHYFDEINDPAKAYWLGFLYADAYNCQKTNTISIALARKDHNHLIKLASAVNISKSKIIKGYCETGEKAYPTSSLRLYSKHMCSTLAKRGCPQAKSFIIKYPDWLSAEFDNHFIRGLFDGDGCLTFREKQREWKWSLVSTKECCDRINELFKKYLDLSISVCYISKTNNNTYILSTSGNEKIHKVMKWLHNDSVDEIRLARKFLKYEQLVTQQNNRLVKRKNYLLSDEIKKKIISSQEKTRIIAERYEVSRKTVRKLKNDVYK